LNFVGYILDTKNEKLKRIDGHPILGDISQLAHILKREAIDELIFILPRRLLPKIERYWITCQQQGVNVRVVMNYFKNISSEMWLDDMDGIPLLSIGRSRISDVKMLVKRIVDIVGAILGIIISSPVMLITAILIKIESSGPVLFVQKRCGKNGRIFNFYKFRSMVQGAD
jgi:hypothetical protein